MLLFPYTLQHGRNKGGKESEVWEFSGNSGTWNPRFIKCFNDWELEQVQIFIRITNNKRISLRKDILVWKGQKWLVLSESILQCFGIRFSIESPS